MIEDLIVSIKDEFPNVTPTPPALHAVANVHELKSRLQRGEPALTIFDVRNLADFLACRIMGGMYLPLESLQQGGRPELEAKRDICVYGELDVETEAAANLLRESGFIYVAELRGGLKAWRSVDAAIEGFATQEPTEKADLNMFSRLKKFSAEKHQEDILGTE